MTARVPPSGTSAYSTPCQAVGRMSLRIEVALIGQVGADHDVVVIGERHAQVLGLTAGHLPVELRVAEQRGAAAVLAHLGGLALRLQPARAHEALAARDVERDDDAVADGERRDVGADGDDDAHRLVAEDVAAVEERAEQFVQVQVGAADRGRGDPDDRIGRLLDDRIGTSSTVTLRLPCQVSAFIALLHGCGVGTTTTSGGDLAVPAASPRAVLLCYAFETSASKRAPGP